MVTNGGNGFQFIASAPRLRLYQQQESNPHVLRPAVYEDAAFPRKRIVHFFTSVSAERPYMPLVVRSLKRWLASKARRLKSGTSASVARRPISGIGRVTSFARLSGRYVPRSEAFGSRDRGAQ